MMLPQMPFRENVVFHLEVNVAFIHQIPFLYIHELNLYRRKILIEPFAL